MELLREEKAALKLKSDLLIDSLEYTLEYTKDNMGSIVREAVVEAVLPSLPPFIQQIIRKKNSCLPAEEYKEEPSLFSLGSIVDVVLDFLPFVLKGKKGLIASVLLKKIFKRN